MLREKAEKAFGQAMEQVQGTPPVTNEETTLEDLGLDSLDIIDLQCELERTIHTSLPDEVFGSSKKVSSIIDYLERNC